MKKLLLLGFILFFKLGYSQAKLNPNSLILKGVKLEKINDDNRSNRFKILSVRFNKALYAPSSSFFFKKDNQERNVNLGVYKKNSKSNEYDWIINCS